MRGCIPGIVIWGDQKRSKMQNTPALDGEKEPERKGGWAKGCKRKVCGRAGVTGP